MDVVTFVAVVALRSGIPALPSFNAARTGEFTQAVSPNAIDRWTPFIADAAQRFGIPEAWIRAVMRAESGGQTMHDGRPITSPTGAMGLMQIMPETYADLRRPFGLSPDPHEPHDNILAGAAYLRQMFERYGYPALFAAYNAGPGRFEAYVRDGENLPVETWDYLAKLGPGIAETMLTMGSTTAPARQDRRVPMRRSRLIFRPGARCFSRSETAKSAPPQHRKAIPPTAILDLAADRFSHSEATKTPQQPSVPRLCSSCRCQASRGRAQERER